MRAAGAAARSPRENILGVRGGVEADDVDAKKDVAMDTQSFRLKIFARHMMEA